MSLRGFAVAGETEDGYEFLGEGARKSGGRSGSGIKVDEGGGVGFAGLFEVVVGWHVLWVLVELLYEE